MQLVWPDQILGFLGNLAILWREKLRADRGIQNIRSTAAAINRIAVTTKPEMSPGFTAFQPSKSIRFSLWSTASRMVC